MAWPAPLRETHDPRQLRRPRPLRRPQGIRAALDRSDDCGPAGRLRGTVAASPTDYRKDGARHLYERNGHRIYKGKLPPLLHAVGVLQVEVDDIGDIKQVNWMRAPSHAPDVMREIERTVRAAAPFPAPVRMGRVTYTEVWLWDKSGNFQLDTLTEGQRSK